MPTTSYLLHVRLERQRPEPSSARGAHSGVYGKRVGSDARGAVEHGITLMNQPSQWTFLTNHAHVLLCIARDPSVRLRDVADAVGITERAAQRIVQELEAEGYLEHERVGRRNSYRLNPQLPLRHPLDREHRVAELLSAIGVPETVAELRSV